MNSQIIKIIRQCESIEKISDKTQYYQFGFSKFGSFLYGFTEWLISETKKRNIKKIIFFSRDGYMMKKAYDYMSQDVSVECEYAYFSRNSLRQALLWDCADYKDTLKYLSQVRFITVRGILEYYGFTEQEIEDIVGIYGINPNKSYVLKNLAVEEEIACLYGKLENKIREKSKEQYELLKKYIIQLDMHGNCGVVDIGWNGSMQYYLESFIKLSELKIDLQGFYVGIQTIYPVQGKVCGYLYDNNNASWRKKVLCFLGGLEKLFQSCEGSSFGYIEKEGIVEPVKKTYEYDNDEKCVENIQEWQMGAMDFIRIIMSGEINIPKGFDFRNWAAPLIKFGQYPSNSDVRLFSFFYIEDGGKQYFTVQKKLWQYNIKDFIRDFSDSPWKTGFMKSAFKLPLPYYFIYRILRK